MFVSMEAQVSKGEPFKVLVVDDKRAWQSKLRSLLRRLMPSAEIICASNRDEMISWVMRREHPDLITMDGNFYIQEDREHSVGPAYVSVLRQLGVKSPIIMVTNDDEAAHNGVVNGANARCSKARERMVVEFTEALKSLGLIPHG